MELSEFDQFAEEYEKLMTKSIAATGETPEYFHEYKAIDLKNFKDKEKLRTERILDLGAGVGNSIPYLKKHLPQAQLIALDVSSKSIEIAQKRFPGMADFVVFDGNKVPFPDQSMDVVQMCCVLHHIEPENHLSIFKEIFRLLKPGQALFIFEHNPLNPLTRKAVRDCPFDENAILLWPREMKQKLSEAGFSDIQIEYKVFFPKFLSWLRPLEKHLAWLPLGAQYRATGRKPK